MTKNNTLPAVRGTGVTKSHATISTNKFYYKFLHCGCYWNNGNNYTISVNTNNNYTPVHFKTHIRIT